MSKDINFPDSQNDVITTVTHALVEFETMVRGEMPEISTIYDEQLTYETAVTKLRAMDNYSGSNQDALPMLAYNRSVLRDYEEGFGKRAKNSQGCLNLGDGTGLAYSVAYGEIDIRFIYFTKNIELMEKFEVVYGSDEGITGSKELIVNMGSDIGEFKYYLAFGDLEEKEIIADDVYYKGIIGSIKLRGFYFTFRAARKVIEEINQRIYSSRDLVTKEEKVGDIQIL